MAPALATDENSLPLSGKDAKISPEINALQNDACLQHLSLPAQITRVVVLKL